MIGKLNKLAARGAKEAVFAVKANHNEAFYLWSENRKGEYHLSDTLPFSVGTQIVGHITVNGNEMSVVCEVFFKMYRGFVIMFYNGCSSVVDHRMIDHWIRVDLGFEGRICNAMNFNNALVHCDKLAKDREFREMLQKEMNEDIPGV